ncbi:MAG: hypothetical protein Q8R31_05895 [Candidatus Omnitrophota bacterium]|nr:hypothetical protein [Candidatus Omnitrophota bacterium]
MTKRIKQSDCPTCGRKSEGGAVQEWEVPEIAVFKDDGLNALSGKLDELTKNLNLNPLLERIDKLNVNPKPTHLHPTPELLQHFEDCPDCVKDWEVAKKKIVEDNHPGPSAELVQHFEDCPECSKVWNPIKKAIEDKAKAGLIPEDSHIQATEETIANWESCPDCKPKWDKIKESLLVKAKPPEPKAEEKEKWPWDKD